MTTPPEIRHLLARVANSVNVIEARLPHAGLNTLRQQALGYPTTASGNANQGGRGTPELQPTEAAAHTNLGGMFTYPCTGDPCTEPTHYEPGAREPREHIPPQRPGPTTRYADLADELRAALTCLDRANDQLTTIGVPPLITQQFRCRGINGTGCTGWIDKNRQDRLCIDCGRKVDLSRRATRDRRRYHGHAS